MANETVGDVLEGSPHGLSDAEVEQRVAEGKINIDASVKTRSFKQIFYSNIFTLFNAINVVLAILVVITGSYKNMLFMLVILCNTVIGIVQEIRSKQATDRLSILAVAQVTVIRNGKKIDIPIDGVVVDDLIVLGRGDQIPSDSVVVAGMCDVNESLLTGESKLVKKEEGSELMSGSFVNSGSITARVVHVGAENYAAKISAEAKQHKAVNSEIMNSLNGIIKFVSFIIFPVGLALYLRAVIGGGIEWNDALLSTVAALVGMIPEGLILLTSTVLAVSVIRLAQSKVLVQQLYCIETLARVDTLCLDKTGTITTGFMKMVGVEAIGSASKETVDAAFASLASSDENPNETAQSIIDYYKTRSIELFDVTRAIPFSSDKKWSGASFSSGTSYVMGAARFIMEEAYEDISAQAERLSESARVMLVAEVDGFDEEGQFIGAPVPLGFVIIEDEIRETAASTIKYFIDQGVTLKVISGDDPHTVSGIAEKVGIPHADSYIDAATLESDTQIAEAIEKYSVFGRVKPEQKKAFVVALQEKGHIVAMTGDGVNDTLALKQSDCSVAMAAGSDAARNVGQLVLIDNDFASMPKVVAEGRRSINNLQRSASLFLVKTLFSITLAILFVFLPWQYPFQPIQMTLISAFTIGIPSFVLALEPNKDRIKGKFLENVIIRSIPGALTDVLAVLAITIIGNQVFFLDYAQVSTICVLTVASIGAMLIARISYPYTPIRVALLVAVVGGTILGATVFHELFAIEPLSQGMEVLAIGTILVAAVVFLTLYQLFDRWHKARQDRLV